MTMPIEHEDGEIVPDEIAPLPFSIPTALPVDDCISPDVAKRWATWGIVVYMLDSTSESSAYDELMRLKDSELAPQSQLHATIPNPGQPSYTVPIPMHLLQVFPASGALQQGRYHSRAILSFAPSDFETDKVNPWVLEGLLSHLQRLFRGRHPVRRISSNGNDRSLVLNYTVSLPDTTLDQANEVYESRMAELDKYLKEDDEYFAVDITGVAHFGFDLTTTDDGEGVQASASVALMDPAGVDLVARKGYIGLTRWSKPEGFDAASSSFGAMALTCVGDARITQKEAQALLDAQAAQLNKVRGTSYFIFDVDCSNHRWVRFCCSDARLSWFIAHKPMWNGRFARSIVDLNSGEMTNQRIERHHARMTKQYKDSSPQVTELVTRLLGEAGDRADQRMDKFEARYDNNVGILFADGKETAILAIDTRMTQIQLEIEQARAEPSSEGLNERIEELGRKYTGCAAQREQLIRDKAEIEKRLGDKRSRLPTMKVSTSFKRTPATPYTAMAGMSISNANKRRRVSPEPYPRLHTDALANLGPEFGPAPCPAWWDPLPSTRGSCPLSKTPQLASCAELLMSISAFLLVSLCTFCPDPRALLAGVALYQHVPSLPVRALLCLLLAPRVLAAKDPTLTLLNFNVQRLGSPGSPKINAIIDLVLAIAPSVFILTETPISDRNPHIDIARALGRLYNLYITTANNGTVGGITCGVLTSIPSEQVALEGPDYQPNILPVRIRTPFAAGSNRVSDTLIIGIYAPHHTDYQEAFYDRVTRLVDGAGQFILSGDFNMVLRYNETTSRDLRLKAAGAHNGYRDLLQTTGAVDLLQLQPDCELDRDWTREGTITTRSGERIKSRSMIDRIAVSHDIGAGHVETLHHTIQGCDHRPVFCRLPVPVDPEAWTPGSSTPRLLKPKYGNDPSYQAMRDKLQRAIEADATLSEPITDAAAFRRVYAGCHAAFTQACETSFRRPKPRGPTAHVPTKEERHHAHTIKLLTAARLATETKCWGRYWFGLCPQDKKTLGTFKLGKSPPSRRTIQTIMDALQRQAGEAVKADGKERAAKRFTNLVRVAIETGSAKRMAPNQALRIPPILALEDKPGEVTQGPHQYIARWHSHYQKVLHRDEPPEGPKPWLHCAKARKIRRQTEDDPFRWPPPPMTAAALRQQLSRGKSNPSPGPDGWEKWALLRSGDAWLTIIAGLANYIAATNDFQPINDNFIIPLYKKGDTIQPDNYRGIVLGNLLHSIVATRFTNNLSKYSNKMGLIPDTQIAGHAGAQVSDMSNFLNSLDGWGRQTKVRWLALKRDQRKGFDYVHSSAFTDVVTFFGLPAAVLQFDQARTKGVRLRVRSGGMLSDEIITDGQTKQGDAFSPLKYALVMSMASWWVAGTDPDIGVTVRTPGWTRTRGKVHTWADEDRLTVQSVAAMDDTILFAADAPQLSAITLRYEVFQLAYGMETEWDKPDKTTVFWMGGHPFYPPPEDVIELEMPDGSRRSLAPTKDRWFLRTPINDPTAQSKLLIDKATGFLIPKPGRSLPLPAVRRIIVACFAGMLIPALQRHPIRKRAAVQINKILNAKIANYYHQPFPAKHGVLFSKAEQGGFNFPDTNKLNAVWSITNLHRMLNHTNDTMARCFSMFYYSRQCHGLKSWGCRPPFALDRYPWKSTQYGHGPANNRYRTWIAPSDYMSELGIGLVAHEDHLLTKAASEKAPADPSRGILPSHLKKDPTTLSILDKFIRQPDGKIKLTVTQGIGDTIYWATDGSADAGSAIARKRAAMAVVGPTPIAARIYDDYASSHDAEIAAMAVAVELDDGYRGRFGIPPTIPTVIYTDHLFTQRLAQAGADEIDVKISGGSRHMIRWLAKALYDRGDAPLTVIHQKSHTSDTSRGANMNRRADHLAKGARTSDRSVAPISCHADHFMLTSRETGISHAEPALLIDHAWTAKWPYEGHTPRNITRYQDHRLLFSAVQASSALTQLWTRSGQLPTKARRLERRLDTIEDQCATCDRRAVESDDHHVFLFCHATRKRLPAMIKLAKDEVRNYRATDRTESEGQRPNKSKLEGDRLQKHIHLADAMFRHDPLWEDGMCRYWVGEMPKHFEYEHDLGPLYCALAGWACKTAAHLWGFHRDDIIKSMPARPPIRVQVEPLRDADLASDDEGDDGADMQDEPDVTPDPHRYVLPSHN